MRYVLKKTCAMLVTLFIVTALAFLAFQIIPGDPTTKMLGTEYTPELAEALRADLGLDRNIFVRYFDWLLDFLRGDFGISYSYSTPVRELLAGKITITAFLSLIAFIMTVVISLALGLLFSGSEDGPLDRAFTILNQITMSIPPFFIGIIFTSVFGLFLKLFVVGEFINISESFGGFIRYLIFPALAIALPKSAMTIKLLRSSIRTEMRRAYVRTAYSRGNSRKGALRNHVFRNSLIPVVTFLATIISDIVVGSIIIEQVFSIPGLGRMLLLSISGHDYPVVQAIIVLIASLVVIVHFLADVIYQFIDPRIRLE